MPNQRRCPVTTGRLGKAKVAAVVDVDMVGMEGAERVRHIGMDTPMPGESYGREATEANRGVVGGKAALRREGFAGW